MTLSAEGRFNGPSSRLSFVVLIVRRPAGMNLLLLDTDRAAGYKIALIGGENGNKRGKVHAFL